MFILSGLFESETELKKREKICGMIPSSKLTKFPWMATLRQHSEDQHGSTQLVYRTGTIVSNKFIVTSAEIFSAGTPDPDAWKAAPSALGVTHTPTNVFCNVVMAEFVGNVREYHPDRWIPVISIVIHPLYNRGNNQVR